MPFPPWIVRVFGNAPQGPQQSSPGVIVSARGDVLVLASAVAGVEHIHVNPLWSNQSRHFSYRVVKTYDDRPLALLEPITPLGRDCEPASVHANDLQRDWSSTAVYAWRIGKDRDQSAPASRSSPELAWLAPQFRHPLVTLGGIPADGELGVPVVASKDHRDWLLGIVYTRGGAAAVASLVTDLPLQDTPRLHEAAPMSWDARALIQKLPPGPAVDAHWIRPTLAQELAAHFLDEQSLQKHLNASTNLRRSVDPEAKIVPRADLPNGGPVSGIWDCYLDEARLHGPRMLASVLLVQQGSFTGPQSLSLAAQRDYWDLFAYLRTL